MSDLVRIGMVIDPVGGYGRGVIRGIMTYAREHPAWVITIEPRWAFDRPLAVENWDVDGMIVQVHSRAFEEEILARGVIATNVSNFISDIRLPTAVPDDRAIGRLAAEYLRSKGLEHFACFGTTSLEFSRLRWEAFKEALADIAPNIPHISNEVSAAEIIENLRALPRPAAILGGNDDAAHHLLQICRLGGIRVPDDVAVLGVDDDELLNSLVVPSLSSIRLSSERIGYEAAAMLDRLVAGEQIGANTRVLVPPVNVVTRESTDLLAVADREVADAVRFIRAFATKPINVDEVAESVAVSRRSLERRFRASLGRGVLSEIRRVQIDRAKRLLVETDMPMPEVATGSGFSTSTRLGIAFRKAEKLTPSDYRHRYRTGEHRR